MVHPELEITRLMLGVAAKCRLGLLLFQLVQDFPISDIAHLVVLLYHHALFVAHPTFALLDHRIARLIGCANIAVDAFPSLFAVAVLALAW